MNIKYLSKRDWIWSFLCVAFCICHFSTNDEILTYFFHVKVEFSIRFGWRRSHSTDTYCSKLDIESGKLIGNDEYVECFQGCSGNIGTSRVNCTDFSEVEDWSVGERSFLFTFASTGPYYIGYVWCYHLKLYLQTIFLAKIIFEIFNFNLALTIGETKGRALGVAVLLEVQQKFSLAKISSTSTSRVKMYVCVQLALFRRLHMCF